MTFDPNDFRTWTQFDDHPIFGQHKANIAEWSLDASQYCKLSAYSTFMPEWYVHTDRPLPVAEQRAIASRDLINLANACRRIIETYGPTSHEVVILDDFTVYVWLKNERFHIEFYPMMPTDCGILLLFIESPVSVDELPCSTIDELIHHLHQHLGT